MSVMPLGASLIEDFEKALVEFYMAKELAHPTGHRQFTNPWSEQSGQAYIWIMKTKKGRTPAIRFGASPTKANFMSEGMIRKIATRQAHTVGLSLPSVALAPG